MLSGGTSQSAAMGVVLGETTPFVSQGVPPRHPPAYQDFLLVIEVPQWNNIASGVPVGTRIRWSGTVVL